MFKQTSQKLSNKHQITKKTPLTKAKSSRKTQIKRSIRRAFATESNQTPPPAPLATETTTQDTQQSPSTSAPIDANKLPLNIPVPGLAQSIPRKMNSQVYSSTPVVTTLKNKIKVFTQECTVPVSHFQVTVRAGSKHENNLDGTSGYTNFLAQLLTNVTSSPDWEFAEDLQREGAHIEIVSEREYVTFRASTAGNYKPIVAAVADLVGGDAWKFLCDINEEKDTYKQTFQFRASDPGERFQDDIHYTAYFGTPLGYPVHGNPQCIEGISTLGLARWQKKFFTGNRMLIGGVGVDEAEFPKLVEEFFGNIATNEDVTFVTDEPEREDYLLMNIHNRLEEFNDEQDLQHVSIGWHGPDIKSPFIVPMTVLRVLLGEAAEWSSGGPGKGMYSRMTTNLVGKYDYIAQGQTFFMNHNDTSLFGVYGMVQPDKSGEFIERVLEELTSLSSTITELEVDRAKNQLKRQLSLHYQDNSSRLDEISRSLDRFDKWIGPEYLQQIDQCSVEQVKQSASLLFDPEALVISSLGNPDHIPAKWATRDLLSEQVQGDLMDQMDKEASKGSFMDGIRSFFGKK